MAAWSSRRLAGKESAQDSSIEKCLVALFLLFFFLSGSSSPRLCVAVVIPGRWMEAGISNGCGKVRGRVAGGPELSTSGQLPQPGWVESFACPGGLSRESP